MHLWQNKTPGGKWYIAAGAGMGRALLMADEKRAYILSDSATFATLRDKTDLRIIATNNPPLKNEYSTIIINPARHPHINIKLARRFGKWLLSPQAQSHIAAYRRFGGQLFIPAKPQ